MSYRTLTRLAHQSARAHGHKLARFYVNGIPVAEINENTTACKLCGMEVTITPHPRANEAQIAGEAVALHCRGRERS